MSNFNHNRIISQLIARKTFFIQNQI